MAHPGLATPSVLVLCALCTAAFAQPAAPGWEGRPLASGSPVEAWELDGLEPGTGGALGPSPDAPDALRLRYSIGPGGYVQIKRAFAPPLDLSDARLFGLTVRPDGDQRNNLALMFVDGAGQFIGADLGRISAVGRWLTGFPLPRTLFTRYWGGSEGVPFDWGDVRQVFVTVKRPAPEEGGGAGTLDLREITWATPEEIPPRPLATHVRSDPDRAARALAWLVSQQGASGFVRSWQEESEPRAYLYDQALALLAFARGAPEAAARLAEALTRALDTDGRWPRVLDAATGAALATDDWLGDQAWAAFALASYGRAAGDAPASAAARRAAARIASLVHPDGSVEGLVSTEGALDVAWALLANGFAEEADRVAARLLERHWDAEVGFFYRGAGERPDAIVACDAQTWGSALARRWNRPEIAERALRFARAALVTRSADGSVTGLDGQGPVSVWCEGTAQFVVAGGPEADAFLAQLEGLQAPDGAMPGGADECSTDYGWITRMHGASATAWFYFAQTGSPFPERDDLP